MSETAFAPKKKAIEFVTVKIALVLCVIALLTLFLPCVHFSDAALIRYSNIEHNDYSLFTLSEVEQPVLFIALILLACYIAAAVLFYTDHPKLVLLPAIIALLLTKITNSGMGGYSENGGYMTFWPAVQLLCNVLLIIFAAITKKADPKYIK